MISQPVRELSLGERMRMELIAALLHSPELLLLDEPTIGLDVVSQRKLQVFLKEYQEQKQTTVLLTSHYMKDVAALCRRVVIIANGQIMYDGSLTGIIAKFSGSKVISLAFADDAVPAGLERFGTIMESQAPKVQLRVSRSVVAESLSAILARHTVQDVSVEDPPLEEVIAEVFSQASRDSAEVSQHSAETVIDE